MTRTLVIADVGGNGGELARLVAAAGWDVVAVLSSRSVPAWLTKPPEPELFVEVLEAEDGFDEVLGALRRRGVDAVVAGTETGVELGDALAEHLGVPGNGTALSAARRDKGAMQRRLRDCGLAHVDSLVAADRDTLAGWATRRDEWPVVVKPVASGGSDNIWVCSSVEEVAAAYEVIRDATNVLGSPNRAVIAQEFLRGTTPGSQYMVNSVSVDGHHLLGEIWRFDSLYEDGRHIYDKQELLLAGGEPQETIARYAYQTLDALGIRFGPAHTEIMLTERGPVLIETAARMTGGLNQRAVQAALGYDQITLTAESVTDPAAFLSHPRQYELRKHLGVVALRSRLEGRLAAEGVEQLLALPTQCGCTKPLEPGTPVTVTDGFVTCPGLLYLVGDTMADIERDTAAVRRLEASGRLYVAA